MTRRPRSFTLLEVMVSVGIAATVLVTLQNIIADNVERVDDAIKQRNARTLARQKLEEFLASAGAQGSGSGAFDDQALQSYRYNTETAEITVGETGKMIRVTVTVSYSLDGEGGDNSGRSVALTSYTKPPEGTGQ